MLLEESLLFVEISDLRPGDKGLSLGAQDLGRTTQFGLRVPLFIVTYFS